MIKFPLLRIPCYIDGSHATSEPVRIKVKLPMFKINNKDAINELLLKNTMPECPGNSLNNKARAILIKYPYGYTSVNISIQLI